MTGCTASRVKCARQTHDQATVPDFAFERILAGKPMPGVFVMNDRLALRQAIDEILSINRGACDALTTCVRLTSVFLVSASHAAPKY